MRREVRRRHYFFSESVGCILSGHLADFACLRQVRLCNQGAGRKLDTRVMICPPRLKPEMSYDKTTQRRLESESRNEQVL